LDSDTKKYLYIENEAQEMRPYDTLNNFISSGGLQVDITSKNNKKVVKTESSQKIIIENDSDSHDGSPITVI
jgi:hypothetical protein